MVRPAKLQFVHYATLRNLESGELIKAWPFVDIEKADQKRKEESKKHSGDLSTVAWLESLDTQMESYPARFKNLDPRKVPIRPLSERK